MRYLAAAVILVLAGCQTQTPPPPTKPKTVCEAALAAITDPRAYASTKMIGMEIARNHGCFGQPQPQRIQIDQTVRIAN